jgi:predicted transcriptional regulator
MTEHPVSVRLDDDAIQRLERIAEALSKRAGGVPIKRGTAVRAAVQHGIESLEAELGLTKKKR